MYRLTAPCKFGLEKTLSFEIKRAGGEDIRADNGRVSFSGDESVIARTNITCSVAERIGIVLAEFDAKTFDDVFFAAQGINIESFAAKNDKLHITGGHSLDSALTSIPALQRTIKKGLVLRMQKKYGITTLSENGSTLPMHFLLMKDRMTIILDTSGDGLHKRGYRALSNAAPIKETLAAGMVDIAKVRAADTVIDPMCGSGTILIEAAMKAAGIAPCLKRSFAAEHFGFIDKNVWKSAREEAAARIKPDCGFSAYGYDIDPEALKLARENSEKAGTSGLIRFEKRDIKDFHYPAYPVKIITNPPYAKRMGTDEQITELYRTMGGVLLPRGDSSLYIITPSDDFEKLFGEKAAKTRKLYNGMIMCRLYSYF